jgi:hypothetical protein
LGSIHERPPACGGAERARRLGQAPSGGSDCRRAEGNGDARKGLANRIVLTGEFDDEPDVDLEIERYLSADRVSEWMAAAELVGLPLAEFIVVSLDRAALAVRRASASAASRG